MDNVRSRDPGQKGQWEALNILADQVEETQARLDKLERKRVEETEHA